MKPSATKLASLILGCTSVLPLFAPAQSKPDQKSPAPLTITVDYPKDQTGVLIDSSGWTDIEPAFPSKTRVKRGIAASLTYGAIPAGAVSEYEGLHALVQLSPGRPVLCICHVDSIPGTPLLVRLHPKKNFRELDGGRLPILGGKVSEATKNDLVEVDISQPENTVWLIRPRQALLAGEYALMLGTQNLSIFPFRVSNSSTVPPVPAPEKH
jgi:hypothetical protein